MVIIKTKYEKMQELSLTDNQRTAAAMISSGFSFKEASDITKIPTDQLMEIWQKINGQAD